MRFEYKTKQLDLFWKHRFWTPSLQVRGEKMPHPTSQTDYKNHLPPPALPSLPDPQGVVRNNWPNETKDGFFFNIVDH